MRLTKLIEMLEEAQDTLGFDAKVVFEIDGDVEPVFTLRARKDDNREGYLAIEL